MARMNWRVGFVLKEISIREALCPLGRGFSLTGVIRERVAVRSKKAA